MEQLFTPCYIIDENKFVDNVDLIKRAFCTQWGKFPVLGYSVKTNNCTELMSTAKHEGMLAEVVSDDEYRLAINCGYSPQNIIYNGPQKSELLLIETLRNLSLVNLVDYNLNN